LQTWFKLVHVLHASTESDFDMAGLSNVGFWPKADIAAWLTDVCF
jgi:hypothetical protein